MKIYRREQIKEEARGEYGLAICRDSSGRIWTIIGGLTVPLSEKYEEFRRAGLELELVTEYDGIKPVLAGELANKEGELNEGKVKISDLDKILLREAVEE